MNKRIQISEEDWEKLKDYHMRINDVLFETFNFTTMLVNAGSFLNFSEIIKDISELHRKVEPLSKFIFTTEVPFGIVPLKENR